jgi:hypothetical protein
MAITPPSIRSTWEHSGVGFEVVYIEERIAIDLLLFHCHDGACLNSYGVYEDELVLWTGLEAGMGNYHDFLWLLDRGFWVGHFFISARSASIQLDRYRGSFDVEEGKG